MLKELNENILGPLLITIITAGGTYLLFICKLKPFVRPKAAFSSLKKGNGLKTACLSLAGTLGVGNVTGVSSAIAAGGAGAVFWMWFFSIFACIVKYSEIVLAHTFKSKKGCGTAYYIEKGIGSKVLGTIFSLLLVVASVGMGNMVQCASAADGLNVTFGIPKILIGMVFSLVTLILIAGGRKRVSAFTSVLIPILSLGYFIISLSIIVVNIESLPSVLAQIFDGAINIRSVGSGLFGFLTCKAVRLGASRGILSNEAGCGTSPYAQDQGEISAVASGIWGIVEVVVDTVILCSMTAFVLLITRSDGIGMDAVIDSYSYFGSWGGRFIGISTGLFGLASVVCWSYYGMSAVRYLGGKKTACILYAFTYSIAGLLGSVFRSDTVWCITDITVSVMAIFNTACVIRLSRYVKKETETYFS